MGKIVESRGLYEYVSDNGIVYEIGANGADFNIIIDNFMDYEDDWEELWPINSFLVDYVFGEIEDPDVIEWIDKRIERYENHERVVRFYSDEPCECYIGFKEEKQIVRKRIPKEDFFSRNK